MQDRVLKKRNPQRESERAVEICRDSPLSTDQSLLKLKKEPSEGIRGNSAHIHTAPRIEPIPTSEVKAS